MFNSIFYWNGLDLNDMSYYVCVNVYVYGFFCIYLFNGKKIEFILLSLKKVFIGVIVY